MYQTSDVSVVIPVYGAGEFLVEAVASVANQEPGEIVVVDDGSSQELPDLSGFSGLRLLRHATNRGASAARNTGVKHCTKTWVAFNDADDLWVAGRLRLQLDLAERYRARAVHGRLALMSADGGADPWGRDDRPSPGMSTYLLRREVALRLPLDEELVHGEDLDFYMRLKESEVELHSHPEVVHRYRRHGESLTAGRSGEQTKADIFRLLSRSLSRRRGEQPENES